MEVDKYNLEGGIRAMRQAALWLTQWADDLEKADRAGGHANAAGPPDRLEVDASFDRIMQVMTALCAAELSNQVHSLILSYGASCLSEVPKEKYGDLLAAAYRLAEEGKVALPAGDGNG